MAMRLDQERSHTWTSATERERADALLAVLEFTEAFAEFPHARERIVIPDLLRPGAPRW